MFRVCLLHINNCDVNKTCDIVTGLFRKKILKDVIYEILLAV